MSYRIGSGVDFHQLKEGRDLWIGGIKIPHSKGSLGHSDADVLLHAICDAMLGALALGDIGVHFPDTNDEFKDRYSFVIDRIHKTGMDPLFQGPMPPCIKAQIETQKLIDCEKQKSPLQISSTNDGISTNDDIIDKPITEEQKV